jgi:hypothetical protein
MLTTTTTTAPQICPLVLHRPICRRRMSHFGAQRNPAIHWCSDRTRVYADWYSLPSPCPNASTHPLTFIQSKHIPRPRSLCCARQPQDNHRRRRHVIDAAERCAGNDAKEGIGGHEGGGGKGSCSAAAGSEEEGPAERGKGKGKSLRRNEGGYGWLFWRL